MGGAPAPISFEAIHFYALRSGTKGEEFDDFAHLIRYMDSVYMDVQQEEAKKQKRTPRGKGVKKAPPPRRTSRRKAVR